MQKKEKVMQEPSWELSDTQPEIIRLLIKSIKGGFGKEKCKGFSLDCPICKSKILIDLLEWYVEILEYK